MPSQSRAFEASFESSDKPQVPHGGDPERMLEDFDTFFEKINSLDQADWRKAHPANPERAAAQPAVQPAAPNSAGKPGAGKPDPLAGLRTAVAQAKQGGAGKPARFAGLRAGGTARFALLAIVLFAVGMSLGWAALSLPGKSDGEAPAAVAAAPEPALLSDPKGVLGTKDGGGALAPLAAPESKASASGAKEVLLSDVAGPPKEMLASSTSTPQAGDTAQATAAQAAASQTSGAQSPAGTGTAAATIRAPSAKAKAAKTAHLAKPTHSAAAVQTAKARPASPASPAQTAQSAQPTQAAAQPATHGASGASSATAGEAHFAVQVGACRSPRCVDSYRQLVAAHLQAGADPVRVVTVPAEGKEPGMQRVRIAPLDKASAQRLKDTLIQADARLSGAYVVELH